MEVVLKTVESEKIQTAFEESSLAGVNDVHMQLIEVKRFYSIVGRAYTQFLSS